MSERNEQSKPPREFWFVEVSNGSFVMHTKDPQWIPNDVKTHVVLKKDYDALEQKVREFAQRFIDNNNENSDRS